MSALVDLGSSKLNTTTGMVTAQCKGTEREDGSAEDFGDVNMCFALGFASMPAAADKNGAAQGLVLNDVPGQDGVCVGAVDARSTKSYYDLAPGETVIFSTGKGYDARVFCKDQLIALIVGDDVAVVIDRKSKRTTITSNGCHWEQSEANGTVLTDETGGASLQLKGGIVAITGTIVLGGRIPTMPFAASPGPVVGVTGSTVPTAGIFWGQ